MCKYVPYIVFLSYAILLIVLAVTWDIRFFRVVLVPAVTFFLVTVFRRAFNFPRPYEKLEISPLIPRNKKGQSFPSRHVASVFIIAMALLFCCPPAGIAMLVIGCFIAVTRVLAGIHFPRDVVAGAVFSIAAGAVGFFAVPMPIPL